MRPRLDVGLKAKIALEALRNGVTVAELAVKIGAAREPG
jgi:transposase-like protein